MRFLRRSLIGVFMLAASLGLLAMAGNAIYSAISDSLAEDGRQRTARERVFSVTVVPVLPAQITPEMTAFGELRATQSLDLRAKSGGTVVALHPDFQEGGRVKAGALLVRVDPVDAQSALAVAQADLSEAEAELVDAQAALGIAQDDLTAARAQADLRDQALTRQISVRDSGFGSDARVEEAELAAAAARQSVLSKRQTVANTQTRLSQAGISLSRRQIALAEAERDLADTEIYAAFDGVLSDVSLVEGGLVTANENLAQLVAQDVLEVSFRLSTAQYARLLDNGVLRNSDLRVVLSADGFDLTARGTITRESAEVGEGQTGRLIFATLGDTAGFRAGDFVTVLINEPPLDAVAVLPSAALGADGTVLAVGADERLQSVAVTLLRRQGNEVIVSAPELAGREVVAARTPLLGEGLKVRVVRPATQGDAAAQPDMVELTEARRQALIDFVQANDRMPADIKERILAQLGQDKVPAQVVERLEGRMGG